MESTVASRRKKTMGRLRRDNLLKSFVLGALYFETLLQTLNYKNQSSKLKEQSTHEAFTIPGEAFTIH